MSEFTTTIRVLVNHINYGNHLANDAVVSLFHESRIRYLQSRGHTELNINGVGILVTELTVKYHKQAYLGDELECSLSYEKKGPCSGLFTYKLSRQNESIASGTTTIAFFDYTKQRLAKGSL